MKIGFIGTGNMAGAIMSGLINKGIFQPDEIIGSDISEQGRQNVKDNYGICVTADNGGQQRGGVGGSACSLCKAPVLR